MAIEYEGDLKDTNGDDILDWNNNAYKLNQVKDWLNTVLENKNIIAFIDKQIKEKYSSYIPINFCHIINGGNARVLKGNSSEGWKKGKLQFKLVLEFIPDEPEIPEYQSPLDEIRNHPSFPNS
jgi:hypothetical protein